MSNGNNKKFLKSPVKFAQTRTLSIGGQGGGIGSSPEQTSPVSPDLIVKGGNTPYSSVKGGARVLSANLETETSARVSLSLVPYDQRRNRDFPIFFLPWQANRVTKIKLSTPDDVGGDVRIFFTAALTGCSVFVEGDPKNPTVYHANAKADMPDGLAQVVDDETNNQARRYKELQMRNRVAAMRKDKPAAQMNNLRVVEPLDYDPQGFDPADGIAHDRISRVERTRLISRAAKVANIRRGDLGHGNAASERTGGEAKSINPYIVFYGTVFGLKNKLDNWEFYYQCKANVVMFEHIRGDGSKINDYASKTRIIPAFVRQFWPNGGGVAVARPVTLEV